MESFNINTFFINVLKAFIYLLCATLVKINTLPTSCKNNMIGDNNKYTNYSVRYSIVLSFLRKKNGKFIRLISTLLEKFIQTKI